MRWAPSWGPSPASSSRRSRRRLGKRSGRLDSSDRLSPRGPRLRLRVTRDEEPATTTASRVARRPPPPPACVPVARSDLAPEKGRAARGGAWPWRSRRRAWRGVREPRAPSPLPRRPSFSGAVSIPAPPPHPPPGDPLPLPRTRAPGGGEAPAADSVLLRRTGVRGALDPVLAECGVAVREAQASQDTLRASIAQLTGSAPPPPSPLSPPLPSLPGPPTPPRRPFLSRGEMAAP